MGLLGQGWDDPQSQAIMALAGGLMQGNAGAGLLGANQAFMQAKRAQQEAKYEELRGLLAMAQLDNVKEESAAKRDDRARQAALAAKLPSLIRQPGYSGGEAVPQSFSGTDVPMFSAPVGAAPMQATPGGFDMRGALLAGMSPEVAQKYAGALDYGLPEVARVEETMVNGRPVKVQLDKRGNTIGNPLDQWKAPVMQNLGGSVAAIDPVTLSPRGQFPMTMSPEGRDASARGWASNNIAQQKLALDQRTAEQGKWQYDGQRGGLVNMQTGEFKPATQGGQPVETKASREAAKEALQQKSAIANADSVLKEVRDAKGLVGWNTAGLGGVTQIVPATEGRDLSAKMQTIKANLGFDRLQQMRQESPTGGALGQVAVQELAALQATVASLDQLQSPTQLGAALDKIENHYTNWRNVMEQSRSGQGGASGGWDPVKEDRYQKWKAQQGGAPR